MTELLAVGAGGALGSIGRYLVNVLALKIWGSHFPYGTLIVNVLGSFTMGIFIEWITIVAAVGHIRFFLVVGGLGGFTTFSTFSLDVAALYERGQFWWCTIYVLASLILSIAALFLGLYLVRQNINPQGGQ